MEQFIGDVVNNMRKFQKLENIKGECVTNTQYSYDSLSQPSETMKQFIGDVVNNMRKFQKLKNIKRECVTNTQYLYDSLSQPSIRKYLNVTAKAVVATSKYSITSGHMVLNVKEHFSDEEFIIDPSYEIYSRENKEYYESIRQLIPLFKEISNEDKKELIKNHIHFMKLAEKINNGICLVVDKKFYNEQADYIALNVKTGTTF